MTLISDAVCVCDIDIFDIGVKLCEEPREKLDVKLSGNLLRLRTCSDTIALLAEAGGVLAKFVAGTSSKVSSGSPSREVSETPHSIPDIQQVSDDVIPDLEDAMAELDIKQKKNSGNKIPKKDRAGAQVFFFPDESKKRNKYLDGDDEDEELIPQGLGMTESILCRLNKHVRSSQ